MNELPSCVQVVMPGSPITVYNPTDVPTKYSTPLLVTAIAELRKDGNPSGPSTADHVGVAEFALPDHQALSIP